MALVIMSETFAIVAILKWVRKYMAWPEGICDAEAGAGRLRVLRMGRRVAEVSPPVKPPGPESQVESSNPGVCQLSSSWHTVLYLHTLVRPKMLKSWAFAVNKRKKVMANTRTPAFATRAAMQ